MAMPKMLFKPGAKTAALSKTPMNMTKLKKGKKKNVALTRALMSAKKMC